tara:strand:+ start:925 stop:1128 length:204 start_codon:yes stop_codon:yes gene_type:complete
VQTLTEALLRKGKLFSISSTGLTSTDIGAGGSEQAFGSTLLPNKKVEVMCFAMTAWDTEGRDCCLWI